MEGLAAHCVVALSVNMSRASELRDHYTLHWIWEQGVLWHPATCGKMQRLRDIPKKESLQHGGYLSHIPVLVPAYHFLNGCFVLVSS